MSDDFYKLMRLYEGYEAGFNQSNYPSNVSNDVKNSYTTPINGPGNTQANATGGGPSTGDLISMPGSHHKNADALIKEIETTVETLMQEAEDQNMDYALEALSRVWKLIVDFKAQS